GADKKPGVVDIDHHNEKTGRGASILQALERLGVEPSLTDKLVAANDTGYIPAMVELLDSEYIPKLRELKVKKEVDGQKHYEPISEEEVQARKQNLVDLVRAMDRKAQGVTKEMEDEAVEAIKHAVIRPDGITVVEVNGSNFAPVQDRLY